MTGTGRTILVASQYFAPKNEIASVRIVNMARELHALGWEVDVLTVDANLANPLERRLDLGVPDVLLDGVRVVSAPVPAEAKVLYRAREAAARVVARVRGSRRGNGREIPARSGGAGSATEVTGGAAGLLYRTLLTRVDRGYIRTFARAQGLRSAYDVVLVSFGPRYMVDAGVALADRFPGAAFVMDVRDPVVRRKGVESEWQQEEQRRAERLLAERADGTTVVSQHMIFAPETFRGPIRDVPNGFSVDPTPERASSRGDDGGGEGPLRVFYGGRLYAAQRLDVLAAACLELSGTREVVVDYAGPDSQAFVQAFAEHGAQALVRDHGRVSRPEALELAAAADVAVVLSWNTDEKGVMTGKIYELIATDVPILVLVAGDHAGSSLASVLAGDPLRRVFNSAADPDNTAEVRSFLEGLPCTDARVMEEFSGPVRYESMSYPAIVAGLDDFLTSLLERR